MEPDPELTHDRLTKDVWLWQRKKGHRFSVDDVATAFVAVLRAPAARKILDLGSGIGSVLLHLAWSLPDAELWGIEAQPISFALLTRNLAESGFAERVHLHHGDLREPPPLGLFDLITGTPPYFPVGTALPAADEQRAYARIEHRGGVEAYLETAARLLAPAGLVVLCGASDADARVLASARALDLHLQERVGIVARAPKPPLFTIWVLGRTPTIPRATTLTIRDTTGERTPEAATLRAFSGL